MPAIFNHTEVLDCAVRLAKVARLVGVPILGTEQNPARLGPNVAPVASMCDRTLAKMHFSAVADGLSDLLVPPHNATPGNARSLPKHLRRESEPPVLRRNIIIAGCEAHICVLQTALQLLEEEFDVSVVVEACGSRRERDRDAAFDRLAANGVELVTTEMLAFEWLRTANHPRFKEVQALIK